MMTRIEIDEDRSTAALAAVKVFFSNEDDADGPEMQYAVTVRVFVARAGHETRLSLEQAAMGKAKRFLMHI